MAIKMKYHQKKCSLTLIARTRNEGYVAFMLNFKAYKSSIAGNLYLLSQNELFKRYPHPNAFDYWSTFKTVK